MEDIFFEAYKKRVYEELSRVEKDVIPAKWWDSVIKHYFGLGYSEDRTVRTILETMKK